MFNKKILCIGNETSSTDLLVSNLANLNNTINYGLISDQNFIPINNGFYHTTILDLVISDLITVSKRFDQVMLLDQPVKEWPHPKSLLTTFKICKELELLGIDIIYKNNENIKNHIHFDNFIRENKSFCIYPWINFIERDGGNSLCARSPNLLTAEPNVHSWNSNNERQHIKSMMLEGKLIPEKCQVCYDHENMGIESYRQYETKEWLAILDIATLDDLTNITSPYYYELTLNNTCNIKCRGCSPAYSSSVEKEFKEHNIKFYGISDRKLDKKLSSYSNIDKINIDLLTSKHRVYLAGGEPTAISEVYTFMQQCIDKNVVDFEFTLGTNGVKFSNKFLELSKSFTRFHFSISLDGFGKINDYWRWGSNWETIIENIYKVKKLGHNISINCVPGLYNITNLHLLYEFLDKEFPDVSIYLQVNYLPWQNAFNHPNVELVLESLLRCKRTKVYQNDGKSNKTAIDELYDYYSNSPSFNLEHLSDFFKYNDQLDRARNSSLKDYIPELEECRKYLI